MPSDGKSSPCLWQGELKTKHMLWAVVWLVSKFNHLAYDWMVKDESKVTRLYIILDLNVSQENPTNI
jgi:hypothetical protein